MKKSAFILTILLLVSRLLGMGRELILSHFYHTSIYTDAYFLSRSISNIVFGIFAAGMVTTFIPMYIRTREQQGTEKANRFMNNATNFMILATVVLSILGMLFPEALLFVFANDLPPEAMELTIRFVRVGLISIVFSGIRSMFEGYHQSNQHFFVAPVAGLFVNFILIFSILISVKTDPIALAWGLVAAALFQAIFVYVFAKLDGYKHRFFIDFKDENLQAMMVVALPIILGSSVDQINAIVDQSLASGFGVGAISKVNYANLLNDAILSIFVATMTTILYPKLAKQAFRKDYEGLKETLTKMLNTVNLLVIPGMIGMYLLAYPIVRVTFGRGFTPENVTLTAQILQGFVIGLIAYAMKQILVRTFYALQDSKTPVRVGVFGVALNIGLDLYLMNIWGLPGLAYATSFSAMITMLLLYFALRKKLNGLRVKEFMVSFSKTLLASTVMGITVFKLYHYSLLTHSMSHALFVSVGVGVIIYMLCMHFLKVPEYKIMMDSLWRKIYDIIRRLKHKYSN